MTQFLGENPTIDQAQRIAAYGTNLARIGLEHLNATSRWTETPEGVKGASEAIFIGFLLEGIGNSALDELTAKE